ncbi:hypothetical protein V3C99_005421 [Haemonchus contortus]
MRLLLVPFLIVLYSNLASSRLPTDQDISATFTIDFDSRLTCLYQGLRKDMSLSVFIDPSVTARLAARLTSPSGEFSEWTEGTGQAIHIIHNVTEDGDYEICVSVPFQLKALFHLYAFDEKDHANALQKLAQFSELENNLKNALLTLARHLYKIYFSIKFYNQVSVRDEALQEKNSYFIKTYVILFCMSAIIVGIIQVALVRRMFRVDTSRIRI